MSKPLVDLLDELEFFNDFSYAQVETISRYFGIVAVSQGETIFNEGDPGSYMLILISGRIAILKSGEHGRHLLSYEGSGRIVGEMALLDRERRSATCVAELPCEFVTLSHDGLDRLAAEHPKLGYLFMSTIARLLSRRLRRTSGVLAEHMVD